MNVDLNRRAAGPARAPASDVVDLSALRNKAATLQPVELPKPDGGHINIVIASFTLGGAERCVRDIALMLRDRIGSANLFILGHTTTSYPEDDLKPFRVIHPAGRDRGERLRRMAIEILASPTPRVFTHLIRSVDLKILWNLGVETIPVIHNSRQGWHEPPSVYDHSGVPAVVAVCGAVRNQLKAAGLARPVAVLRHELPRTDRLQFKPEVRDRIRRRHGIPPSALLIGMVGQFKAHKGYVRAVRVLAEVLRQRDARLMILGGWDHDYGAGRQAYTATMAQALELGVVHHLICTGPTDNVEEYYSAFDLLLNTSVYEGMSISTLEAVEASCPVVTADVGGQHEAISERDVLVERPADIASYVAGITRIGAPNRVPRDPRPQSDLVARIWVWLGQYGFAAGRRHNCTADTLFVTSNLNPGGAQRSLTNLLKMMKHDKPRPWLCVLDRVLGDDFIAELMQAEMPVVGLGAARNLLDRVESSLALISKLGVRTVCFWNVDPIFKLLIAKVLEHAPIRLVDVSPGPMLFEEMEATGEIQRRIAFTADDYFRRLDVLVSKYRNGIPAGSGALVRKRVVIPNGVAQAKKDLSANADILGPGLDPHYALVTSCRLVPNKRLEFLVDMMEHLADTHPLASLTVVGGLDQRHIQYFETILDRIGRAGLTSVRFAGANADYAAFLPLFRIFVMVSRAQGCPNASLEAMACGLPIIANADGGTNEQIKQGLTGYLVDSNRPDEMARRVADLLDNPERAQAMGAAAREFTARNFSLDKMVERYRKIL